MDLSTIDDIQIHFIVGPGRTGTTLLVALLNECPDCVATPEIHHFVYFYRKYKNMTSVSRDMIDDYKAYLKLFFDHKNNPLIGPPDHELMDALQIGQPITYAQFTKLIYLGLFGRKGIDQKIRFIIDKNPYYTLKIDMIMKVFPGARILALTRDYRAYILSNMQSRRPSVSEESVLYYACVWNLYMRHVAKAEKTYGQAVKVVRYESLALEKEATMKEIMPFFGLEYSEAVFDFHVSMKEKIKHIRFPEKTYDRMMKKIKDLSSPVNPSRVDAWKTALSPYDTGQAELISGSLGSRYGYLRTTRISPFKKLFFYLLALPSYTRVKIFEILRSTEIHFYYIYKSSVKNNDAG
jgi:hypothetical protein